MATSEAIPNHRPHRDLPEKCSVRRGRSIYLVFNDNDNDRALSFLCNDYVYGIYIYIFINAFLSAELYPMSGQPSPEGARSHRRMLMLQLEIQYLTHQFEACANVSRFCLECRPRSVEVKKQKPKGAEAGRGNSFLLGSSSNCTELPQMRLNM